MASVLSLKPSYYQALKRLTLEIAGINLGEDHRFLVETRLSALARQEGYSDLSTMIDELFSRGQTRLAIHVVSALLERATKFFEDRVGYEILGDKLLPSLHPLYRGGTVTILSYGCSCGQEVYSAAIVADKLAPAFPGMDIKIVGVDYPSSALERAKRGRYTHFEVQRGLPIRHLIEYFERDGEDWTVKESLKARVSFKAHNLMSGLPAEDKYQIIMFRGHQAQFTPHAAVRVMREVSKAISQSGYLLLGSGEDIGPLSFNMQKMGGLSNVYQKPAPQIDPTESQKPQSEGLAKMVYSSSGQVAG